MKRLLILWAVLFNIHLNAQYADKNFFLVDSLEIDKLDNYDIGLLDSILHVYHKEKNDTVKLNLLGFLVENLEDARAWEPYNFYMMKLSQKALENKSITKPLDRYYKNILAGAYNNLGTSYNQAGKKQDALNCFLKSQSLLEEIGNKQGLSDVYNNIGLIYKNVGQISKTLEFYFKCLKICDELKDRKGKASSLNNIGMMYLDLEEYQKGLEYLEEAMKEWEKLNNKRGMSSSLSNLGLVYSKMGKKDLSLQYYFKALVVNEKTGDKEGIGTSLGNIGWVYFEQKKYEKALDYFERSLVYRNSINDKAGIAYANYNLGSVYRKLDKYPLALEYGKKALDQSQVLGYPDIIKRSSLLLYSVYKEKNQPQEALKMYELFISMRDSINNEQTRKAGLKKQYQYEFDLKEKEYKSEQEKRNIQHSEEVRRQKLIIYCALIGGSMFVVFSFVLYQRFRLTHRQKAIIENQKLEIDNAFTALREKNKEVVDSIYYARRIQNALLTSQDFFDKNLKQEYFIFYKPKDIVSGDFYWATNVTGSLLQVTGSEQITNNQELFYLAVCDSTGHGVPGAFMSLINIGFLSEAINEKNILSPEKIFNYSRKRLIENVNKEGQKDGFDGTLVCLEKNKERFKIKYASANCKPIIVRNKNVIELENDRMPVGMSERKQDFNLFEFEPEPGDTLYLLTDGFADQFGGPKGKKYKYKPLQQFLASISDDGMAAQQQRLNIEFESWKGPLEQVDDVCIIGLRF